MIKKICLFLCSFLPFCEAQIIETPHVADVLPFIDEETWVLVDLDNTLFEAKQALGHTFWFFDEVDQLMMQGMERNEAISKLYPLWIQIQNICQVKPIEQELIPALIQLQNKNIIVMGLTHRQHTVSHATLRQIQSLNFDFTVTAPSKETFSILAKHPALYSEGVLFVSDYNKKGEVFIPFLSLINQKPKRIVFLDDKLKNVEDLENSLADTGIEYLGVFYTAIYQTEPIYSRELAQIQLKLLNQIMSNESIISLIQNGFLE